uniref:Uncharacterized protein n=1 Tax=Ditylenchus dipsaci TaxID=166011 RepID=A0A915D3P5_9BILA
MICAFAEDGQGWCASGAKISDFVELALFDAFADEPFYVVPMQYFRKKYEKMWSRIRRLPNEGDGDTCSAVKKSQVSNDKEQSLSFLCKTGTKTSSLVFKENGDESLILLSLVIGDEIRKFERSKSEDFSLPAVFGKVAQIFDFSGLKSFPLFVRCSKMLRESLQ